MKTEKKVIETKNLFKDLFLECQRETITNIKINFNILLVREKNDDKLTNKMCELSQLIQKLDFEISDLL